MVFMGIDDSRIKLNLLEDIFELAGKKVITEECGSVEEALRAIDKYKPDVVFLDHQLTRGGNEGLEILGRIVRGDYSRRMLVYSTTEDIEAWSKYHKLGVEVVSLINVSRIIEIANIT